LGHVASWRPQRDIQRLRCFFHKTGLGNRDDAIRIPVESISDDGTKVMCQPVKFSSGDYEAGIILTPYPEKSLKTCVPTGLFRVQNTVPPKIKEAVFERNKNVIVISFDINIECLHRGQDCSSIFKTVDSDISECICKDRRIILRPFGDDFPFNDYIGKDSSKKLVFKAGNGIIEESGDQKLSVAVPEGTEVKSVHKQRGGKHLKVIMHSFMLLILIIATPLMYILK
jgi:hypothetical protein